MARRLGATLVLLIVIFTTTAQAADTLPAEPACASTSGVALVERPVIGGIPQGIVIRGNNASNPVLLYLHGGPGRPVYPALYDDAQWSRIENLFTVAYWDQRGTGMSNPPDLDVSSINLDSLVEDTAAVASYLRSKFDKEKIYLLGHSWGSVLGSHTAFLHPQLFHAYIGVGQSSNQARSEAETLAWLKSRREQAADENITAAIDQLRLPQTAAVGSWLEYLAINRPLVHYFRGARYDKVVGADEYVKAMAALPHYTKRERDINELALRVSLEQLWLQIIATDLSVTVPRQSIPVFIFQGVHDYQTTYRQARVYFDNLQAPTKRFYRFEQAAHWPHVEQYDDFERIVRRDILGSSLPSDVVHQGSCSD
ncbi:alpha/beta fold hydrolase [Pseudohalioglobus sediminis]|uniref:alpha/beta fold hydrolase n=1 Tax=Pseudohalioglobus sediminis TaxID=2606449 RepID=UPI00165F616E|nr:alpha/beta hydrolase [Pseudohalioglobus sediminis]